MNGQEPIRKYTRSRSRRRMLDVDLNAAPPCERPDHEGSSMRTRSQDRQAAQQEDATLPPPIDPPIDLEAIDDDVVISSPRAFAEAKNNSRRNGGRSVVVELDSDERTCRYKRRRIPANQPVINCDLINLEGSSNSTKKSVLMPPPPPPPPKEPTFNCPVCMGPLVEEMSTKCGHIFCKACIKNAIAAQSKCPTCRRKTTLKDLIRVYLPATGST